MVAEIWASVMSSFVDQLVALIQYNAIQNLDFIHVYFCEATDSMQYRSPNANRAFSNTNHFGSVDDSLGRLAASLFVVRFWSPDYRIILRRVCG